MNVQLPEIRLKTINLLVTNRCNLWCSMCDYKVFRHTVQDLRLDQIITLIDDARDLGLEYLNISGGEPMVRNDIYDIISHASKLVTTVSIMTNGTLIGEEEADKLVNAGLKTVVISLEGFEEFNDAMRGKGNFKKSIQAIRHLQTHRNKLWCIKVGITLSRQNYKQIYDFSKHLIEEIGIDSISLSPFNEHLLHWKKTEYIKGFQIQENDMHDLRYEIDRIIAYYKTTGISTQDISFFQKIPDYFAGKSMVPASSCYQPFTGCAIEANGNVYPCWGDIRIAGNITSSSLKTIIGSDIYIKGCHAAFHNQCKGCLLACYDELHSDR